MKETFKQINIPIAIIITAIILGGFYFATEYSKQKSIERERQFISEQEEQERLLEEEMREQAKQSLNDCIDNAEKKYLDLWNRECKSLGLLTSRCIDIQELTLDDYFNKYNLNPIEYNKKRGLSVVSDFENTNIEDEDFSANLAKDYLTGYFDYLARRRDECSCRLSVYTADRFNEILEKDKAECFKKYPQN